MELGSSVPTCPGPYEEEVCDPNASGSGENPNAQDANMLDLPNLPGADDHTDPPGDMPRSRSRSPNRVEMAWPVCTVVANSGRVVTARDPEELSPHWPSSNPANW